MRFPRISATGWLCAFLFTVLAATVSEQLLREKPAAPSKVEEPQRFDPKFAGPFKIGQEAPGFTLKDAKGRQLSLASFRGKRVLLNFYCGCSVCRGVAMAWKRLLQEPHLRPTATIAVASFKPEYDPMFRKETGWNWPIVFDTEHREVATKYDSRICPRVWVLDEKGKILFTNPSPVEVPPGPDLEFAVRPLISLDHARPGGLPSGAPRATVGHLNGEGHRAARG